MRTALKTYDVEVVEQRTVYVGHQQRIVPRGYTRRVYAYTPEHARAHVMKSATVAVLSVREVTAEDRLRALGIDPSDTTQVPPWDRDNGRAA